MGHKVLAAHEDGKCIYCNGRLMFPWDESKCEEGCGGSVCASCHICPDCTPENMIGGILADVFADPWM